MQGREGPGPGSGNTDGKRGQLRKLEELQSAGLGNRGSCGWGERLGLHHQMDGGSRPEMGISRCLGDFSALSQHRCPRSAGSRECLGSAQSRWRPAPRIIH